MQTRDDCVAADRADILAPLKALFELPAGVLYFDGNSLGVKPRAADSRAAAVVAQQWGQDLIRSWNTAAWFDLPVRLGVKLAPLLGVQGQEVVVTDSTSLNLFKVLAAALRIQQGRKVIVSERDNFPTDLYMIESMMDFLDRGYELRLIDEQLSLEDALDDDVAVVVLSHVNYRSGAMYDMAAVSELTHAHGGLVIWDLAHAAGAVPLALAADGADFAVGCTYKYLNGGPGSPAFLWVAPRHHNTFWQPLSGWWSHKRPFAMADRYEPAEGVRRYLCGTQPITSLALVECGLDIAAQADMTDVRRKSLALSDLFIALVSQRCADHPLTLITPRSQARRGSHVSFRHPQGFAVMQALIARGVIGDYREPEVLRFGLTPLYVGYADVWDAVEILRDVLDTRAWDQPQFRQRAAVT